MNVRRYILWCIKGIRRKIHNMTPAQKKRTILIIISLFIGALIGNGIGQASEKRRSQKQLEATVAEVKEEANKKTDSLEKKLFDLQEELNKSEEPLPWNLVLVNGTHLMEEGYVPELTEFEPGHSVDTRIANAVRKMLADAEEEGLKIQVCSAYRSVKRQGQVFGDSMKERVKSGMGYWEAYEETALNVALPGTSEHALGLALDLISEDYTELDEGQRNTQEAKWLEKNCWKYGFILRYPPEKTNLTGITYEPWHFRYVGEEHAKKIMEQGVCLEEYLLQYNQTQTEQGGQ